LQGIYKLQNEIKNYDWGANDFIPSLLDLPNLEGKPYAELWMGVHHAGHSRINSCGKLINLETLISGDKEYFLGNATAAKFGSLPFLFKVLAVKKPLSVQVHPTILQAKEGSKKEDSLKIDYDAPERNYKDTNHKPEIICALTPFRAMCGFRKTNEIAATLKKFNCAETKPILSILNSEGAGETNIDIYKSFLKALFATSKPSRENISAYITKNIEALKMQHNDLLREWEMVQQFHSLYPTDPAVLSPLFLNVIDIKPGEAFFLPAGILHAYVSGFAVELMSNSDNVLRGGLTNKHIDSGELISIMHPAHFMPKILQSQKNASGLYEYPSEAAEFKLARTNCSSGEAVNLSVAGPIILILTAGRMTISAKDASSIDIKKGESVFISAAATELTLSGDYSAYAAICNI
jgi:mannose-6-phosphate isomerase